MPRTILKARARARAQAQTETGQSRVSRIQGGVDLPFLMLTIVLVAIGLVMLLSASYPSAYYDLRGNTGGDPLYYFKRQGVFALVGFGVMYVVSKLNYRGLKGLAMPILVVACVLMLAVHVPGLGHSSGGATRWLNFPTQWQPSEVGKIALIIFFAARLAKRDQRKPLSFRRNTAAGRFGNLLERIGFFELVPYLIVLILMIGILYLQPHMSAAIQMVVIAAAILFAGGISAGWFIGGGGGPGGAHLRHGLLLRPDYHLAQPLGRSSGGRHADRAVPAGHWLRRADRLGSGQRAPKVPLPARGPERLYLCHRV